MCMCWSLTASYSRDIPSQSSALSTTSDCHPAPFLINEIACQHARWVMHDRMARQHAPGQNDDVHTDDDQQACTMQGTHFHRGGCNSLFAKIQGGERSQTHDIVARQSRNSHDRRTAHRCRCPRRVRRSTGWYRCNLAARLGRTAGNTRKQLQEQTNGTEWETTWW